VAAPATRRLEVSVILLVLLVLAMPEIFVVPPLIFEGDRTWAPRNHVRIRRAEGHETC
jgi:hypothetical protein